MSGKRSEGRRLTGEEARETVGLKSPRAFANLVADGQLPGPGGDGLYDEAELRAAAEMLGDVAAARSVELRDKLRDQGGERAKAPDKPAYRFRGDLPRGLDMLRALPQWLTWGFVWDDKKGKWQKPPRSCHTGTRASGTDPKNWGGFDQAVATAKRKALAGVGFALSVQDGITGIDLDNCRDPDSGALSALATEILGLGETYAEFSPSGKGIRLFAIPKVSQAWKHDGLGIEIYGQGRYLTVTGEQIPGTPDAVGPAPQTLEKLIGMVTDARHQPKGDQHAPAGRVSRTPARRADRAGDGFFWEVNKIAIDQRDVWVPWLFPKAKRQATGGWRITAADLGRALDEDLSVHPDGIVDWGLEQSRTAIDLLIEHGGAPDAQSAALVLCERLGLSPESLGWRGGGNRPETRKSESPKPPDPEDQAAGQQQDDASVDFTAELSCSDKLLMSQGKNPRPLALLANGVTILLNEPEFSGRLRFDELRHAAVCRDLPWRRAGGWRDWEDSDDARFAEWVQRRGVHLTPKTCAEAVQAAADHHRVHPVLEWLDGLRWDGEERISRWLTSYLGVEDTPYSRDVGKCWLISGIARARSRGCKADAVLILEGEQGLKKSMALETLLPTRSWFADEMGALGSKDAAQSLRGVWIVELAELSFLKKAEVETIKAFVSRSVDHYRPSYGRRTQDFPRQCIFAGTTNAEAYLGDETGNRRFWPVKCTKIEIEALKRDCEQIWAEADAWFSAGEPWWLARTMEQQATKQQDARMVEDSWSGAVMKWVYEQEKAAAAREAALQQAVRNGGDAGEESRSPLYTISITEILQHALRIPAHFMNRNGEMRVAAILKVNGYRRCQITAPPEGSPPCGPPRRRWVYRRAAEDDSTA